MAGECRLCPRRCGVDRSEGRSDGFCASDSEMRIARAAPHMWEEPPISGERGSGTIFFTGCTLGCVYCQNRDISRGGMRGRALSPEDLAEQMRSLEQQGVHNISFVTGTHHAAGIIKALRIYRPALPLVWNSGGYERPEVIDALAPWIDIWLPDYKYALREPAQRYSAAPDYPETALTAIKRMRAHQPENVIEDGIMRRGVLVRHLVLPLNTRNSIAALETIAAELPDVPVSLMSQFVPTPECENYPEINRRITAREYEKVCDRLVSLGLDGYTQERASAAGEYVPAWEL